jgi:hypothetical protein
MLYSSVYALILAEIVAVRCSNFERVHIVVLTIDINTKSSYNLLGHVMDISVFMYICTGQPF